MYEVRTLFNNKFFETKEDVVNFYWSEFFYASDLRIIDCYDRQPVDAAVFVEIFNRKLNALRKSRVKKDYTFRCGPVKHTGRSRRRWCNSMRHPRTKQELSQESVTRAKRKHLPTTWDDYWRKSQKSWKSQRKTQYKPVDFSTKVD